MSKDIEVGLIKSNITFTIQADKGFTLPSGCQWGPSVNENKKDGIIEVLTDDGILFAKLSYKNNKLEGESEFFDEGVVCERVCYKNDVKDGWNYSFENGIKTMGSFFENGVKKKKLISVNNMKNIWKEISLQNELDYEECEYDKEMKRQGMCYKYVNANLVEQSVYVKGEFAYKCKEFHDKEMTEYNDNGLKLYQGEYSGDTEKGFVRNGKGKEFENGVVVYVGEWKNGCKEGEGKSMKNNRAYYNGQWKEGLPHGKGKLLKEDGSVQFEGEWMEGVYQIGMKAYHYNTGKNSFMMPFWLAIVLEVIICIIEIVFGSKLVDDGDFFAISVCLIVTAVLSGVVTFLHLLQTDKTWSINGGVIILILSTVGCIGCITGFLCCVIMDWENIFCWSLHSGIDVFLLVLLPIMFSLLSFCIFYEKYPSTFRKYLKFNGGYCYGYIIVGAICFILYLVYPIHTIISCDRSECKSYYYGYWDCDCVDNLMDEGIISLFFIGMWTVDLVVILLQLIQTEVAKILSMMLCIIASFIITLSVFELIVGEKIFWPLLITILNILLPIIQLVKEIKKSKTIPITKNFYVCCTFQSISNTL